MTPESRDQIEELYQAAAKLDAAGRKALLLGADPRLRERVEALLAQDAPTSASPLRQLGPYQIETKLAEGGMGEVYRAFDTRLRRPVAIKILLAGGHGDGQTGRFLHEARAASALNHPNIVTVYDIAREDDVDYMVMEYVSGRTLTQWIPTGGMTLEDLCEYGAQIASALAAAHAAGIVHRDVKPANIMITPERQVKMLDFGIAKWSMWRGQGDETPVTRHATGAGMIVGTLPYMSPEQTRGGHVDARSDIFSLGSVLYQAATGRLPFPGDDEPAVMHAIATATPAPPSLVNTALPAALDRLIAQCIEKSPDRRPADAAEIARALKRLLPSPQPADRVETARTSVAVIPFRVRTGSEDDQYLSVALADAMMNRILSTGKLLVRPMAAVLRYKEREPEWMQVARELNVDVVVQGAVQKVGPKVRVTVEIFRAADGSTLYSGKHDGDMEDLFGLQDRVADAATGVFVPRKTAPAEAAPATKNHLARELYLRALDRLAHTDKFDTLNAIELLTRVTTLDPGFADAWGRLAQALTQMGMSFDPDPQWFTRAETAIATTLDLDPVHCDALCARAHILWSPSRRYQNRAALRALNASLKINPAQGVALGFRAIIYFHLGFYDQGRRDTEESLLVHPGHTLFLTSLGTMELYRGNYAAANECYERVLAANPAMLHATLRYPLPAIALGWLEEARVRLRRARQLLPDEPHLMAQEGLILAREGSFQRAEALADQAVKVERSLTHTHHTWHDAAGVYTLCGKPEKAVEQLRRCAELGLPNYRLFQRDPHLRGLLEFAGFQTLQTELRRGHDELAREFRLDAGG